MDKPLNAYIKDTKHRMRIQGYDVLALNVPPLLSNEALDIIEKGEPFAACYWITGKNVQFSLRSAENGVDVSKIAKHYGGGGHEKSAGFKISIERFIKEFLQKPQNDWKKLQQNIFLR